MTDNFSECSLAVIVENKPTLCSPLTFRAFKNGISVPLFTILHPNNGLRSYTQFDETMRLAMNYDFPFDKTIQNVVTLLQAHTSACVDTEKEKELYYYYYCYFTLQSYPKCNYEQLRDFLVLPCKRKLQYITSSVDKDQVLRETFDKVRTLQQKNVFLLVDVVQIRPTVSFSGGVLSGMADNNRDCKATFMLCIMMKSLHKGPSLMISMTPIHKLTAAYQLKRVKEAAAAVERAGGRVIGSITDNHKVNQQYCKLFDRWSDCSATAKHPLDNERVWFLLFDTVHLQKCIRNNWLSEKGQKISLDQLKNSVLRQTSVKKARLAN
ncbi:hypothetical protein FHG87_009471 [Trinorchestia longiramus]|nr:hypothetical protein FHG87_009471 [Trinorchestia longiramus]